MLLFVTFLPFPTALLADYLLHPEARIVANIYTGTILAISLAFDALWRYASLHLLSPTATSAKTEEAAEITKQYRFGPPLYLLIFAVSFVSEAWSIPLCLLVAVFFAYRSAPMNGART